jgi:hypothetical protein
MKTIAFIQLLALLPLTQNSSAQGFVNLNFESANVSAYGPGPTAVPATNGIPGWTAYVNGISQAYIPYNTVSLGAPSVDLEGTNSGFNPIQGNYFVYLQPDTSGQPSQSAAIGQTGHIPLPDLSLIFWGDYNGALSFGGQTLDYSQTGSVPNYNIYTADISNFSGQTGQLLFTAQFNTGGFIDNIQFSPSAVPEPGTLALTTLGGLLFGLCRSKNHSP